MTLVTSCDLIVLKVDFSLFLMKREDCICYRSIHKVSIYTGCYPFPFSSAVIFLEADSKLCRPSLVCYIWGQHLQMTF